MLMMSHCQIVHLKTVPISDLKEKKNVENYAKKTAVLVFFFFNCKLLANIPNGLFIVHKNLWLQNHYSNAFKLLFFFFF